jgi:hypothetical protein
VWLLSCDNGVKNTTESDLLLCESLEHITTVKEISNYTDGFMQGRHIFNRPSVYTSTNFYTSLTSTNSNAVPHWN